MASQSCPCPNPWNNATLLHGKGDFAHEIKVKDLGVGRYSPGLSG